MARFVSDRERMSAISVFAEEFAKEDARSGMFGIGYSCTDGRMAVLSIHIHIYAAGLRAAASSTEAPSFVYYR